MPRKLRIISGGEVVKILERYGFVTIRSKGSHMRLTLNTKDKGDFHISIPLHDELKRGTLHGIVSELEKYVSLERLEGDFYTQ
jgi:predicted RNA binding protein YcfA (HicA-like mRNA interferase family)